MTHDRPTVLLLGRIMPWVEARLAESYDTVPAGADTLDEALMARGQDVRALATFGHVPTDAALMDRLPRLETIANYGVGYDSVDVAAAAARGLVVTHTPDVLTDEVADVAMGLLIATVRRMPQADAYLRAGHWEEGPFSLSPLTLRGRTLGIVGLGRIGHAIAARAEAFGLAIAYHGRHRQAGVAYPYHATIQSLAEAVDTLLLVVPGGEGTRHLVDADVLRGLGATGVVVNIGRGTSVDEAALAEALERGTIAAAGLDVYADEPRVTPALLAAPNTVLLPHIGSASERTRQAMGQRLLDNLAGWFADRRPPSPVPETPVPEMPIHKTPLDT